MVRIPTYETKEEYTPYQLPRQPVDTSIGEAVSGLGESLGNLGAAWAREKDKQDKQAEFDYQNGMAGVEEQTKQHNTEQLRTSTDGKGTTDATLKFYDEKRAEVEKNLPPELVQKYKTQFDLQRLKIVNAASNDQYKKSHDYSAAQVNEKSKDAATQVENDPTLYPEVLQKTRRYIETAPDLTSEERRTGIKAVDALLKMSLGKGVNKTDPETGQYMVNNTDAEGRYGRAADLILPALFHQESGNRPWVVGDGGASIGLGQINTRAQTDLMIAKMMGGEEWARVSKMSLEARRAYLKNADVNTRYSRFLLVHLLKTYNGNQAMALAAYNAGEGNVNKAIKRAAAAGTPDAWLQHVPKSTQSYVANIMRNRGNAAYLDNNRQQKPVIVTQGGDLSSDNIIVIQSPDGSYGTASNIVDGKVMSDDDVQSLISAGTLEPLTTGQTQAEATAAADPTTPAIAPDSGGAATPFTSPALSGLPQSSLDELETDAKAADTQRKKQVEQQTAAAVEEVDNKIVEDLASIRNTGQGTVRPVDLPNFERAILAAGGPGGGKDQQTKLEKWQRERKLAKQEWIATQGIATATQEEIDDNLRQKADSVRTPEDEAVLKAMETESERVKKLREDDPGAAALEIPEVAQAYEKARTQDPASVQDYLTKVTKWQRHLGFYNHHVPKLLPNRSVENMANRYRSAMSAFRAKPADVTLQYLEAYKNNGYGPFADEVFNQVQAEAMDHRIDENTRLVISKVMSKWLYERDARGQVKDSGRFAQAQEVPPFAVKTAAELAASDAAVSIEPKTEEKNEEPQAPVVEGPDSKIINGRTGQPIKQYTVDSAMKNWRKRSTREWFERTYGKDAVDQLKKMIDEKAKAKEGGG